MNEKKLQAIAHQREKQKGIIGHVIRYNWKRDYRQRIRQIQNERAKDNLSFEEFVNLIFYRVNKGRTLFIGKDIIIKVLREAVNSL